MRQKMVDAHASKSETEFDLKHDPGGIIDVEFIVQYLVLGYASQHPSLTGNLGNIALLRMAAELGLIEPQQGRSSGQRLSRISPAATRQAPLGHPQGARPAGRKHIAAVNTLWQAVFGTASAAARP
jgi:glutamate-ammonia-ligase adenylyltransferase